MISLCPALQEKFTGADAFEQILAMNGKIYRNFKGRKTLRFEHAGKGYFLKIHPGVGWQEIVQSLFNGKFPVLSAQDEYLAIRALEKIGVPTMTVAGYGLRGNNPAHLQSFIITEEIEAAISLEDLTIQWRQHSPEPHVKRMLIRRVAEIARTMHESGVNHRDFYICHFLLKINWLTNNDCNVPSLHVIDLHRSQVRPHLPERWRLKDLAGLHFSSMDAGLTHRDRLRFISCYENRSVRETMQNLAPRWSEIDRKAIKLYRKYLRQERA
jgi:heptose I phosphotransferase